MLIIFLLVRLFQKCWFQVHHPHCKPELGTQKNPPRPLLLQSKENSTPSLFVVVVVVVVCAQCKKN
jgi:hypothetical protein